MAFLVLVPLLPLLTAFIVMTGDRAEQDQNARAGLLLIVASFLGALLTLVLVTSGDRSPSSSTTRPPSPISRFRSGSISTGSAPS